MAKIDLERKRSSNLGWLWALLALLVVGVLAWWFVAGPETDGVTETAEYAQGQEIAETAPDYEQPYGDDTVGTTADATDGAQDGYGTQDGLRQSAAVTAAEIVENPEAWNGMPFRGEVRVTDVPTDRGFWIADTATTGTPGEELFVVIDPKGDERPDVNADTTIRLQQAMVRNDASALSGQLDAETRRILEQETVFLVVDGPDIQLMTS